MITLPPYEFAAIVNQRKDFEQTLIMRCDRFQVTRIRDATGSIKSTYPSTPTYSSRPCRVVFPSLTPVIKGSTRLESNSDITFLFATDEPTIQPTERLRVGSRWFEVTNQNVVHDLSVFKKVLVKEVTV